MEVEVFINKLTEIHSRNTEMLLTEGSNLQKLYTSFKDSMDNYSKFIPEFFSNNGAANNIRLIYKKLHDDVYAERTIDCIDITEAVDMYNEYSVGMSSFVNDVIQSIANNGDYVKESAEYENKLAIAKSRDKGFVLSIFGGDVIEPKHTVLEEAVRNIELLIDLIPQINKSIDCGNNMIISIENAGVKESSLVNDSIELMFESVENYYYESIKNIIGIYGAIDDAIKSNPRRATKQPQQFRLF